MRWMFPQLMSVSKLHQTPSVGASSGPCTDDSSAFVVAIALHQLRHVLASLCISSFWYLSVWQITMTLHAHVSGEAPQGNRPAGTLQRGHLNEFQLVHSAQVGV